MPPRFPKGRGVAQPAASARALFTSDRATFLTGFARARGGVLAGVVQRSRVDATRHDKFRAASSRPTPQPDPYLSWRKPVIVPNVAEAVDPTPETLCKKIQLYLCVLSIKRHELKT